MCPVKVKKNSAAKGLKAINSILLKTSPMDYLQTYILKSWSNEFGPVISSLANLTFKEGKFLDAFKIVQVSPLPKPGAVSDDMTNYRPIPNFNTISKILECLALQQL